MPQPDQEARSAAKPSFDECGFRPADTPCECGFEESAAWVDLAPTLSEPVAQRYVLMHYGLGEPKLDAAAVAGAFQDRPLDADEARIIAEGWHRG